MYSDQKKKRKKRKRKTISEDECCIFAWVQAQWGQIYKEGKYFGKLIEIGGESKISEFSLFPLLVVAIVFPFGLYSVAGGSWK